MCTTGGNLKCGKVSQKFNRCEQLCMRVTEVRVKAHPMKPIKSPKNGSEIATNAAEAVHISLNTVQHRESWSRQAAGRIAHVQPSQGNLIRQPSPVKTQYRERYTSLTGSVPLMPRCNSTVSTISAGETLTISLPRSCTKRSQAAAAAQERRHFCHLRVSKHQMTSIDNPP